MKNLEQYVNIDKHPYMEISDGTYILVLRNPLDTIVSGLVHSHIRSGEDIISRFDPYLRGASETYIKHLHSYDLSKVLVYDFNDLVSNPIGVLSTIADIKHPLIYPDKLEGSLKDYQIYKDLHAFALTKPDIFDKANDAYNEAMKYKISIV
jgi:hypothetical protein